LKFPSCSPLLRLHPSTDESCPVPLRCISPRRRASRYSSFWPCTVSLQPLVHVCLPRSSSQVWRRRLHLAIETSQWHSLCHTRVRIMLRSPPTVFPILFMDPLDTKGSRYTPPMAVKECICLFSSIRGPSLWDFDIPSVPAVPRSLQE